MRVETNSFEKHYFSPELLDISTAEICMQTYLN